MKYIITLFILAYCFNTFASYELKFQGPRFEDSKKCDLFLNDVVNNLENSQIIVLSTQCLESKVLDNTFFTPIIDYLDDRLYGLRVLNKFLPTKEECKNELELAIPKFRNNGINVFANFCTKVGRRHLPYQLSINYISHLEKSLTLYNHNKKFQTIESCNNYSHRFVSSTSNPSFIPLISYCHLVKYIQNDVEVKYFSLEIDAIRPAGVLLFNHEGGLFPTLTSCQNNFLETRNLFKSLKKPLFDIYCQKQSDVYRQYIGYLGSPFLDKIDIYKGNFYKSIEQCTTNLKRAVRGFTLKENHIIYNYCEKLKNIFQPMIHYLSKY